MCKESCRDITDLKTSSTLEIWEGGLKIRALCFLWTCGCLLSSEWTCRWVLVWRTAIIRHIVTSQRPLHHGDNFHPFLLEPPSCLGSSQEVNASSVTSTHVTSNKSQPLQYIFENIFQLRILHFFRNFFLKTCINPFHARRSTSFNVLVKATSFAIFQICGSINCFCHLSFR